MFYHIVLIFDETQSSLSPISKALMIDSFLIFSHFIVSLRCYKIMTKVKQALLSKKRFGIILHHVKYNTEFIQCIKMYPSVLKKYTNLTAYLFVKFLIGP